MADEKRPDEKSLSGYMFRTSGNKYDTSMGKQKNEAGRKANEEINRMLSALKKK